MTAFRQHPSRTTSTRNADPAPSRPAKAKHDEITVMSDKELAAGDEWSDVLERFIRDATTTLFLLSNNFLESPWCSHEVERTFKRVQPPKIVPIVVTACPWQERFPCSRTARRCARAFRSRRLTPGSQQRLARGGEGDLRARRWAGAGGHGHENVRRPFKRRRRIRTLRQVHPSPWLGLLQVARASPPRALPLGTSRRPATVGIVRRAC